MILKSVANDLPVIEGLGAAFQFLKVSGEVPDEVMTMLNEGPANHIRRNAFAYHQKINRELFGIKRVKDIRAGMVAAISGFTMALLIGIFNSLFDQLFLRVFGDVPDDS